MKFDARLRLTNFLTNIYLAPISGRGLIAAWRGQHAQWRGGFVVRVLWLGFVVRWGYIKLKPKRERFSSFDYEGQSWVMEFHEEPH